MAKKSKKSAVKKTSTKSQSSKSKTKSKISKPISKKSVSRSAKPAVTSSFSSIAEYKIFTEDTVRGLEDQVNAFIKKGWVPIGGIVLQGENIFSQTMLRHEG